MSPWGGRLVDGFSHGLKSKLVCHCWIVESSQGLILVDTGFGSDDVYAPKERLSPLFLKLYRPELNLQNTAIAQVEKLGFQAREVRHIVLTHLDFDHAGGISDFPEAQVHLLAPELEAAQRTHTWFANRRYRSKQWEHVKHWNTYQLHGESWFGFPIAHQLKGLPPEILLVPLIGHTWGHTGVAVQTEQGWMLHAGDAYLYRRELESSGYHCPPGLRAYQRLMEVNHSLRAANQKRLRQLVREHSSDVRVCSSHDAIEFAAYQAAAEPIRRLQKALAQQMPTTVRPVAPVEI
jgi:glyoxylase-like metal-dependent hydrolase (beta-lactamase superfamily II)